MYLLAIFHFAALTTLPSSDPAAAEKMLVEGTREQALRAMESRYAADADDVNSFALGVAQLLAAVERGGRSVVKAGVVNRFIEIDEFAEREIGAINPRPTALADPHRAIDKAPQIEIPELNRELSKHRLAAFAVEHPTRIDREVIDGWIAAFEQDLTKAEATLARIKNPAFRFPVHAGAVGSLGFDVNGNGRIDPQERLSDKPLADPTSNAKPAPKDDTLVVFDLGDVYWCRGCCHFLLGFAGSVRALDGKELIDKTGHMLFPNLESPYAFLTPRGKGNETTFAFGMYGDYSAGLWLAGRMPVYRPGKLKEALDHLQQSVACMKEAFRLYRAETDDDHEWIPNPRQKGKMILPLTPEQFVAWERVLEECELVLAGKKPVPHWRVGDGRGINFRRIFTEPGATFEPVLWFQGSAAVRYLERGSKTDSKVWEQIGAALFSAGEALGSTPPGIAPKAP